jgi:hypothetical protein
VDRLRTTSSTGSFTWHALALLLACAGVVVSASAAGCSGNDSSPCVSAQCLSGNTCVATASEKSAGASQCRFPCATHADCPNGYHCDANPGGTTPFCAADKLQLANAPGQWGASCTPGGGVAGNPACDGNNGFACYGASPTDANAFCTLYLCQTDDDCGHGYVCATRNKYPNLTTAQVTNGETWTVCLPRTYCAPCSGDVDCLPGAGGAPAYCVNGTDGSSYCATSCHSDSQCPLDARCLSYDGFSACTPRAGTCKGDGSMCAPCGSDADCDGGSCVGAYQSSERFCATKSSIACSVSGNTLIAKCPSTKVPKGVTCTMRQTDPDLPPDLCVGLVQDGSDTSGPILVPGCWTVH